jgi:hypothetical protein
MQTKSIFFAHQSIGEQIISGVTTLHESQKSGTVKILGVVDIQENH